MPESSFHDLLNTHLDRLAWSSTDLREALKRRNPERLLDRRLLFHWTSGSALPGPEWMVELAEVLGLDAVQAVEFYAARGLSLPSVLHPAAA